MFSSSLLQRPPQQTTARRTCTEGKTVGFNLIIPGGTDKGTLSVMVMGIFSI